MTRMSLNVAAAFAALAWLSSGASRAQTCASPLPVSSVNMVATGNTCDSVQSMPAVNAGTTVNNGPDVVYHVDAPLSPYAGIVTLQPDANVDLALFLCSGSCHIYTSCFDWVDSGPGNADSLTIPAQTGNLTIVVAHPAAVAPNCGGYSLSLAFPLGG